MVEYTTLGNGAHYAESNNGLKITSTVSIEKAEGEVPYVLLGESDIKRIMEAFDGGSKTYVECTYGHGLVGRSEAKMMTDGHGCIVYLYEQELKKALEILDSDSFEDIVEAYAEKHPSIKDIRALGNRRVVFEYKMVEGLSYGSSHVGDGRGDAEHELMRAGYSIDLDYIEHSSDADVLLVAADIKEE